MPDLTTIVASIIANGILLTIVQKWISDRLEKSIQHEYDLKFEKYSVKLKAESEREITHLKAQLERTAAVQNIKLSTVFEKQAEVIVTVYQNTLLVLNATEDYTHQLEVNHPELPVNSESLENAVKKFYDHFIPHKIYLPQETAERTNEFHNTVRSMIRACAMANTARKANIRQEPINRMDNRFDNLSEQIPGLLKQLENDFQRILGFPKEDKSNGDRK